MPVQPKAQQKLLIGKTAAIDNVFRNFANYEWHWEKWFQNRCSRFAII